MTAIYGMTIYTLNLEHMSIKLKQVMGVIAQTLILTVNNSSESTQNITACDSYLWNGEIYNQSGIYTYQTTTVNGCDSTAILNLTINNSSESTQMLRM